MNELTVPDVATPLSAYRAMSLQYPWASFVGWRPGTNTALCRNGKDHSAPDPACTCGYYALNTPDEVLQRNYCNGLIPLAGVVLSGLVIPGEMGYRAQYAEVVGLCIPTRPFPVLQPTQWVTVSGGGGGGWSTGSSYAQVPSKPAPPQITLDDEYYAELCEHYGIPIVHKLDELVALTEQACGLTAPVARLRGEVEGQNQGNGRHQFSG